MLSRRNLEILTFLLNYQDWISGESLAAYFDLNKKTLQSEIREIQYELKDGIRIAVGKKGYYLEDLTPDARRQIHEAWFSLGGSRSLNARPAALIIFLAFRDDYISMQQIADAFYLSKTAVALSIETVREWVGRFGGVEFEVSGTYGVRIMGSEERKRMLCAKLGSLDIVRSIPVDQTVFEEYEQKLRSIQPVLADWLNRHDLLITGEEYRICSRYLAISAVRSAWGYRTEPGPEPVTGEYEELMEELKEKTGILFSGEEISAFRWLVLMCSSLAEPDGKILESRYDIHVHLAAMEKQVSLMLNLPEGFSFPDRKYVIDHIAGMQRRYAAGDPMVTHLNEEVSEKYPLEVYIVSRFQREIFGMQLTHETPILGLYLAAILEQYKYRLRVLLVTDECGAVAYEIEHAVRQIEDPGIREFKSVPGYIFRCRREIAEEYDILLTTEAEIFVEHRDFYNIPALLGRRDRDYLDTYLKRRRDEIKGRTLRRIRDRFKIGRICDPEDISAEELTTLAEAEMDAAVLQTGEKRLLVCRVRKDSAGRILHYVWEKMFSYKNRRYSELLYVDIEQGDPDILGIFDLVSDYLMSLR